MRQYLKSLLTLFEKKSVLLLSSFFGGMTALLLLFGVLFFLSDHLETAFHYDGIKKGAVLAIPVLFLCVTSYITGMIFIKKNVLVIKWLVASGLAVITAALASLGIFKQIIFFFAAISLIGVGAGLVLPCLNTIITSVTASEKRGLVTSLYGGVRFWGVAIGPPLLSGGVCFLGEKIKNTWEGIICFPAKDRIQKPRDTGITMVIDKGMGLDETADLLGICSPYIDFIKFAFGTPALYPPEILEEKVRLIKSFGVDVYPGGTFLEAAILQGKMEQYLNRIKNIGFTAIEISDGTIRMSEETRQGAISFAAGLDFKILTEVGKKDSSKRLNPGQLADQIKKDLKNGALFVIVEGRDSGINAGLYDREGQFRQDLRVGLRSDTLADSV